MLTKLLTQTVHLRHVSADDTLEKTFFEELFFCCSHLVTDEIEFITVHKLEGLGHVITLLDVCITIH